MEYSRVSLIAGIDHKSWDYFHDFILWDELYRIFDHLPSDISGLVCQHTTRILRRPDRN